MTRNPFAEGLATATDSEQAEFLNAFAVALIATCKGGNGHGMQLFYVAQRLNESAAEVFRELLGSYDYRKQSIDGELANKEALVQHLDALIRAKEARLQEEL